MSKLHVLLKKEELDAQRLPDKVVVVLDVLFATTSIVTALAHGAGEGARSGPRVRRVAAQRRGGRRSHRADVSERDGPPGVRGIGGQLQPRGLLRRRLSRLALRAPWQGARAERCGAGGPASPRRR